MGTRRKGPAKRGFGGVIWPCCSQETKNANSGRGVKYASLRLTTHTLEHTGLMDATHTLTLTHTHSCMRAHTRAASVGRTGAPRSVTSRKRKKKCVWTKVIMCATLHCTNARYSHSGRRCATGLTLHVCRRPQLAKKRSDSLPVLPRFAGHLHMPTQLTGSLTLGASRGTRGQIPLV